MELSRDWLSLDSSNFKRAEKDSSPGIIFLMETKNRRVKLERIRRRVGMEFGVYVDPENTKGGLALWWTKEVNIKILSPHKNVIDTTVEILAEGKEIKMSWVYASYCLERDKPFGII